MNPVPSWPRSQGGFTLIELVIVMVLAGILSAYAASRINMMSFRQTGYFQQALAAIRHGQKLAIATGCAVDVDISAATCELSWNGNPAPPACPAAGTAIRNLSSGDTNFCANATAEGTPSASFSFDIIGRPTAQQTINFGSRTVRVEAETGYAREL